MHTFTRILRICILFTAATNCRVSAQQYTFVDLHPAHGAPNSVAAGINEAGTVVGYILDSATFYDKPIVWSGDTVTILPLPAGYFNGFANDVNDSGVVCGQVWVHDSGVPLAFRYTGTTYKLLPTLGGPISEGIGTRLNNAGDIVGLAYTNHSPDYRHATLWQDTTIIDLGTLGSSSFATDINDSGQITGYYNTTSSSNSRAFLYRNKSMTDIGTVPGYESCQANGMNSKGWIVGNCSGTLGQGAFLWRPDSGMTLLTVPGGYLKATAAAVNDSGIVAGRAFVTTPAGTVHPVIWKNGVMTDLNAFLPLTASFGNLSDINNTGQIVGYLYNPLMKAFMLSPPRLAILRPATSEVVLANEPYDIRWQSRMTGATRIEFSLDSGKTYQDVVPSVPADQNHFTWIFPDTLSTRCKIRISEVADPTNNALSGRFRLKGYVLTRIDAKGDYEAFSVGRNGWSFTNDENTMWPQTWWSQFDYLHGNDPYTGKPYFFPYAQDRVTIADPRDFVDWPLFTNIFQPQYCYKFDGWVTSRALEVWRANKVRERKGSCTGFAISAFLAFTMPTALRDSFPSIGAFDGLRQLPLSNERRKIVNQLSWYQMDPTHDRNCTLQKTATPRQTLAQLKTMLHADNADISYLAVLLRHPSIAHAVNGYRLKLDDRALGRYVLYIYDSSQPNATRAAYLIDSSANTWSPNPSIVSPDGLFLVDPVSTYLRHPVLPGTASPVVASTSLLPGKKTGLLAATGNLYMYATPNASTVISNPGGESVGFADSIVTDAMVGALPIIPATGTYFPPQGYFLPNGSYTSHLTNFSDSVAYFTAIGDTASYGYNRSDATPLQHDDVNFADGFSIRNGDGASKRMNFRTNITLDTLEMTFDITNVNVSPGDSLHVQELSNRDLLIVNNGAGKTYDMNLVLGSMTRVGLFSHSAVTLDANSTHRIAPPWNNLTTLPVKILIDKHNNGMFDDSLLVVNQTTGVEGHSTAEIPREFRLEQNYPNPFNPTTVIRYEVPALSGVEGGGASHQGSGAGTVRLVVYDVLGREVRVLVEAVKAPGKYEVRFDATTLASGVYIYRLQSDNFVQSRKMVLMK
jgi:probable HAF family extracellular repeat protein